MDKRRGGSCGEKIRYVPEKDVESKGYDMLLVSDTSVGMRKVITVWEIRAKRNLSFPIF